MMLWILNLIKIVCILCLWAPISSWEDLLFNLIIIWASASSMMCRNPHYICFICQLRIQMRKLPWNLFVIRIYWTWELALSLMNNLQLINLGLILIIKQRNVFLINSVIVIFLFFWVSFFNLNLEHKVLSLRYRV